MDLQVPLNCPEVSWFLVKRSDQFEIMFGKDSVDSSSDGIGRFM